MQVRLIVDSKSPIGVKGVIPGDLSRVYPASHPVSAGIGYSFPATLNSINGYRWMDEAWF